MKTEKKKRQSKEAKKQFASPMLEILRSEKPVSKWDMVEKLEIGERRVRKMIAECSEFYPVIATSDREGYRLAKKIDGLGFADMELEEQEIEHQLNELNCRVRALKKRMKPLIAYLKVAERLASAENEGEK